MIELAAALFLAAQAGADDGFRPLLRGRDLAGWVNVNTAPSTWRVTDEGWLHCTGRPTGELRTERMYQNFVLELEWRHLTPGGNAGVFVWADDLPARGVPFHRSIEVQVLDNGYGNTKDHSTHGDIFPIHGAKMTPINGRGGDRAFPTSERSKPSPEWNHYRITCQDGAISLAVNGEVVTRGAECSPRKGYICLESEGGPIDYRNLRIRELPDTPIEAKHVATVARGHRSLYDGLGLDGWRGTDAAREAWRARDWVLAFEGAPEPETDVDLALETEAEFGDAALVVDVRLAAGSGVPRIQFRGRELRLDPSHAMFGGRLANGWNRVEIRAERGGWRASLNGRDVDVPERADPAPEKGRLRLVPDGPVAFSNLYVVALD